MTLFEALLVRCYCFYVVQKRYLWCGRRSGISQRRPQRSILASIESPCAAEKLRNFSSPIPVYVRLEAMMSYSCYHRLMSQSGPKSTKITPLETKMRHLSV